MAVDKPIVCSDEVPRKVVGQGPTQRRPLYIAYQMYLLAKRLNPNAIRNSTERVRKTVGPTRQG